MGGCDQILYSDKGMFGQDCVVGRRTAAHLDWTKERLAEEHPRCRLVIIQSAYNTGVAASAGTHDFDACLDVSIEGMGWWAAQKFLRQCGWAAWYRHPPQFGDHIHMVSLGCPCKVGEFVPGQVADYHANPARNGLAGHDVDNTWHPRDVKASVFDFERWQLQAGEEMRQDDWERLHDIERRNTDRVIRVLGRLLGKSQDQIAAEFNAEERRDAAEEKRERARAQAVGDVLSAIDNLPESADMEQKDALIAQLRKRTKSLREELEAAQDPA